MKHFIVQLILILSVPTLCFGQRTIDFEYFRRAGKVDLQYFIKNSSGKISLPYSESITLENTSEEQYFIIELSNLKLGLDKTTGDVKQKKDSENYGLVVPNNPESLTISTENLEFHSITNNGSLSDVTTTYANKKISIYYIFKNDTSGDIHSDLQIRFMIDANEGYRPLKEEHKGGEIISCNITVKSNEIYQSQLEAQKMENQLYQNYVIATEQAYKIKFAREYIDRFEGKNKDRSNEMREYLIHVDQYINPINYDKKLFEKIVQFCINEKELNRCNTLCTQYQDLVWDEPENYKGDYLERAFLSRIELFAEVPNMQWVEWCNKYIQKYPYSSKRRKVESLREEYKAKLKAQKKSSGKSFSQPTFASLSYSEKKADETEITDVVIEMEEIKMPEKVDWASIVVHEDNKGVSVRTGGISSGGYVIEFRDLSDQHIEHDPSFNEEKAVIDLDKARDGKFKSGQYKISVFSKLDRQLLDTNMISYRSTKIPGELQYILMVSCLALGFFSYKRYLKL